MIEVVDRVPTYPGRVKLTPVSGQANTYDMVRADEPIEEGTPINKALFDSLLDELVSLRKYVNDTVFAISQRLPLKDISEGAVIGIYENGVLTPFIVITKNFYQSNRALVLRKDIYKMDSLFDAGDNFYFNSKADRWLNDEYLTDLDAATQAVISPVDFEISDDSMITNLNRKVFLMALWEYGLDSPIARYEGDPFEYFDSNGKRKAYFNDGAVKHYTRTIDTDNKVALIITTAGGVGQVADPVNTQAGIRPAFTLPLTYEVSVLASGV